MRAYSSCDHLAPPVTSMMMKKDMLSIRQKRGKVVEVYDGRKWPVVRCGSVYVTSDDTTQKVTQTVVTATSVAEKKRRASKYTVAVGTSHGHVQAFLEDADSVLAALDQCQAEEKCLMLIKRPKEAARKMLKSHSLSNLSVSDPQLYRQFNGLQLSHVQHPGQLPLHKGKRSSDEQSVTSNDTDRSEPRRRFFSAKGKENLKQQQQQQHHQQQQQQQNRRSHPEAQKSPPDYYHSDSSSSVGSDYRYVSRRDRERDRDSRQRRDLRYSSIPEDAHEINNNGGKEHNGEVPMYHSCHDLSFASQASSANWSDWNRSQGQGHPNQGHPSQIASDQMYGARGQRGPDVVPPTHDPGDMEDAARSRSLGNLSTGLTFSVVGQRKADSMLDLSTTAAGPLHPASSRQDPPPRRSHPAPARHRSEGGAPYPDHLRSPDGSVMSPRNSYPDNPRTPRRSSEEDEVFSPPPSRQPSSGYYNGQPHYHHQKNVNHVQRGNSMPHGNQQQQQNGYAYHSGSSSTSGEQTPQGDGPPPKPKRSLPHVPLNETSERIKRFTEMMRSRMSVCSSSAGRSTANSTMSQTPTTPHTPPSRTASLTDNGSDCEVSTLLDVRTKEPSARKQTSDGHGGERAPQQPHLNHHQQDMRGKEGGGGDGRGRPHPYPYPHPHSSRHPSSSQETPQPYGDHAGESGQTRFTSHSHSSTMDSGYTTNTEGDGDSMANTSHHHLSPPHHPPPYHSHHHHHPHQNNHQPQAAEASPRGASMPRNLSLAAARKFSSMQNVSTGYVQYPYGHPTGPPVHPAEWTGARNQAGPPPIHPKGPAPMRAQHPDHQAEHQRRSWDLAHNFKSLDFMPVTENGQKSGRSQGHEDHVVKPQAVSVGGSIKHRPQPASPRRTESQHRPEIKGQSKQGSVQDSQNGDSLPPPPPHISDSTTVINTVPGHWKYNNNQNNNRNSNNNNTTPPRTNPKPSIDIVNTTTPMPTLFQLSQIFDLCSAKLCLPADLPLGNFLSVTVLQVTLPSDSGSPTVQSPQGRCARLGGPGSAFRPVRAGSGGGGQLTVEVAGIGSTDQQCQQLCVMGEVHVGDLLVEVNGRQCVGMEGGSLQRLLDTTQGEIALTLARKKDEKIDNRVQQLESNLQKMQAEVQRMNEELTKKDARIRELSTMLPWKREEEENGDGKVVLGPEEGAFVIGDNEFVV